MSSRPPFEDRLADWLEDGPARAPSEALDTVLAAFPLIPQRRAARSGPWRYIPMQPSRALGAIAAVVAIAAGAILFLPRSSSTAIVGAPSPAPSAAASTPIATPAPSPSSAETASPGTSQADFGTPLPSGLQARWMGGPAAGLGIATGSGTSMLFGASDFALSASNVNQARLLVASASAMPGQTLRVASSVDDGSCKAGAIGTYGWYLNPDGRTLTLAAKGDACAARSTALAGTWWLDGCKNTQDNCLGDVGAGTYSSEFIAPRLKGTATWSPIFGGLTYTVPAGWANSSDWPTTFGLTPSSDYARVGPGGQEGDRSILLVTQPVALSSATACSGGANSSVAHTVSAEIAAIRRLPGLIASAPHSITVDGHPGEWLDLRESPSWTTVCSGGPGPEADYLAGPGASDPAILGTVGTAVRQRIILLDLGSGDLIAIQVSTTSADQFDSFAAESMAVIDSFRFK
jgi:hypothetical protein